MSTIQEIKEAIAKLSPEDIAALRARFARLDAAEWHRQFEVDVAAGRLDGLAGDASDRMV